MMAPPPPAASASASGEALTEPTEAELKAWKAEIQKRLQHLVEVNQKADVEKERLTVRLLLSEDREDRLKLGENTHMREKIAVAQEKAEKALQFVLNKEAEREEQEKADQAAMAMEPHY